MNAQPEAEAEPNPFTSPFEEANPSTSSPAVEAAERLKEAAGSNIRKLRDAAEAGLRSFRDAGSAAAPPTADGNTATPAMDELRVKMKELHREGEAWARENPTAAMLAAAGAGFVLGLLLKR